MNAAQRFLTVFLFLLSPYAICETSTQVHSLDQLPGAFKSKEGLAKFREQMSGVPLTDGFGTTLPTGLTAKTIVQLIAPGKDASLATLVGMKAWPHRMNTFIAIACLASTKKEYDDDMRYNNGKPLCQAAWNGVGSVCSYQPKEVYLAVIEYRDKDAVPKVIADYGKPLDVYTDWQYTNLDSPGRCGVEAPVLPYTYSRFDFAPFNISKNETAFGIRVGWSEGYAGGGGDFQALMLFTQNSGRIINILSEPIYFSKNIAGDWHENGTRDHSLYEGENIVTFLPHSTNGYHDLQLKTPRKKWKQAFSWSVKDKRYQPVNLTPLSETVR